MIAMPPHYPGLLDKLPPLSRPEERFPLLWNKYLMYQQLFKCLEVAPLSKWMCRKWVGLHYIC